RRLAELREKLELPVTVEFDTVPIHDAISYLVERYSLPIVLVPEEFATAAELEEFWKRPVKIERLAGVELRTVLRLAVNQAKADYQLRDSGLFIFPKEYAASG